MILTLILYLHTPCTELRQNLRPALIPSLFFSQNVPVLLNDFQHKKHNEKSASLKTFSSSVFPSHLQQSHVCIRWTNRCSRMFAMQEVGQSVTYQPACLLFCCALLYKAITHEVQQIYNVQNYWVSDKNEWDPRTWSELIVPLLNVSIYLCEYSPSPTHRNKWYVNKSVCLCRACMWRPCAKAAL